MQAGGKSLLCTPVVEDLLAVRLGLCAVEVRSEQGNQEVGQKPAHPQGQPPAQRCMRIWRALHACMQALLVKASRARLT